MAQANVLRGRVSGEALSFLCEELRKPISIHGTGGIAQKGVQLGPTRCDCWGLLDQGTDRSLGDHVCAVNGS